MLEKIALQKKFITTAQCEEALAFCRGADNLEIALKDYFITKNLLSLSQMKFLVTTYHALKIMRKNDLFGRIAVKFGYVEADFFAKEMGRQKEAVANQIPPRLIGDLWVENKILTRDAFKNIFQASKKLQKVIPGGKSVSPLPSTEPAVSQPKVAPEPESIPENTPDFSLKADLAGGIQLEVDKKGMVALVKKTNYFDQTITPREITKQLKDQGIIHGIVEEEKIEGFIRSPGFKEKSFKIASGTTPKPGNDARIEYYFDTDYLKAGGEDKDGNMDFKERGEVPWVTEGTLLAEKFPMTESRNGINIFNHVTVVPLAVDLPLKFKSGVTPSEDRLKLYSEISGHPRLGMSGNIEVTSTFTVNTDINYKTGHLEYEGDVEVKGVLKDGFRIKGQAIRIDTVDGGEIYALGDVTVLNGVNGAKIYAQGNVSAKFIQNSQICCMGNLSVTREIVNCNIETSGAVLIPKGDVISSQIECNQGLWAQQIGTDMSVPNTITAGVDTFTKKEIDTIERSIFTCKDRLGKIRTKTEKLTLEIKELHLASGRIPLESDRAREEESVLTQKAKVLKKKSEQDPETCSTPLADLMSRIRDAKARVVRLDKKLNTLFNQIEQKEKQILDLAVEREELENILEDLFYEQANFNEWLEKNPGTVVVSVTGQITSGTVIRGLASSRQISEDMANVTIKEILNSKENRSEIHIYDYIESK